MNNIKSLKIIDDQCGFGMVMVIPVFKADINTRAPIIHLFGKRSQEVAATNIIQPGINIIKAPTTLRSARASNIIYSY
jgi:hypothetical protein